MLLVLCLMYAVSFGVESVDCVVLSGVVIGLVSVVIV